GAGAGRWFGAVERRLAGAAGHRHRAPDGDLRAAHRPDRPADLRRGGRAGASGTLARFLALVALGLCPGHAGGAWLRLAGRLRRAGATRLRDARAGADVAAALSPAGHLDAVAGRAAA